MLGENRCCVAYIKIVHPIQLLVLLIYNFLAAFSICQKPSHSKKRHSQMVYSLQL